MVQVFGGTLLDLSLDSRAMRLAGFERFILLRSHHLALVCIHVCHKNYPRLSPAIGFRRWFLPIGFRPSLYMAAISADLCGSFLTSGFYPKLLSLSRQCRFQFLSAAAIFSRIYNLRISYFYFLLVVIRLSNQSPDLTADSAFSSAVAVHVARTVA